MDAEQQRLSDQIDDATQRLLGSARVIAEPDLQGPSQLPGWTRAQVLAHVARGADAMRDLLIGARDGQDRRGYASAEARADDIEHTAQQSAKDLMADLADSAMALRTVARQLPEPAWGVKVRVLDSRRFPASQLLVRRLVEVVLHHGDLGTGYGPRDWPPGFAALDLPEPMRSQREARLQRIAEGSGPAQPLP